MTLSQDSLTLLLICSHLGLDDVSAQPFTLREWNLIDRKLQANALHPADLLAYSTGGFASPFSAGEVERIVQLVS
ncbi:MAG: hypothetical protein Q7U74_06065, partial [Saprospiraceae bacterium]|nr:hypothetical protein [Saprospiraceae bacterium]